MKKAIRTNKWLLALLIIASNTTWAVNTQYVEHNSEKQFKAGEPNQVLISSNGELSLAYRSRTVLEHNDDIWVVNAMTKDAAGNLYVATSGTGALYRISPSGETKEIYNQSDGGTQHIFSLAIDEQGQLLGGTGGEAGKLLRFEENKKPTVLFEDKKIKYIWSISVGPAGRIYLGTGPTGSVLTLNAQGGEMEVLYESKEKNILSIELDADGMLYAGGDEYGLIYRIDPGSRDVSIVYDSQHGEVSGLVFDEQGNLYAATADAKAARPGAKLILSQGQNDRPTQEDKKHKKVDRKKRQTEQKKEVDTADEPTKLIPPGIPMPGKKSDDSDSMQESGDRPRSSGKANEVYKITPEGYVTSLFNKKIVILSLDYVPGGELLIGTGNQGDLLSLDVDTQEAVILHTAKPSLQISSILSDQNGTIYVGCANPGQVIAIEPYFVETGYYESEVIDADQISQWGKLQVEADIPAGCELLVATRSGNTADPKKGGWQQWSQDKAVGEDIVVSSRAGRFLQYRLQFIQTGGEKTAVVKSVKLAYKRPNQPPRVEKVTVAQGEKKKSSESSKKASSQWTVKWKGSDSNKDQLHYTVYLRQLGHQPWIRIGKELTSTTFKWDSLTVADGRYEIKVDASDAPSNPKADALTHGRIGQPFVVDNSGPDIKELTYEVSGKTVKLSAKMEDALSAMGSVRYSVDSAEDWERVAPADGVYDSRNETVAFEIDLEETGEHLIAICFTDAVGNTTYRNLAVEAL